VKQFDSNTPIVNTATYYVVFSVVMYQLAAAVLFFDFGAIAQAVVVLTFLLFLGVYVAWLLWRYRASRMAEKRRREELLAIGIATISSSCRWTTRDDSLERTTVSRSSGEWR
jgi:amino acid transporter